MDSCFETKEPRIERINEKITTIPNSIRGAHNRVDLNRYKPHRAVVIVTTLPKDGTTLTQKLVYKVCVFGDRPQKTIEWLSTLATSAQTFRG